MANGTSISYRLFNSVISSPTKSFAASIIVGLAVGLISKYCFHSLAWLAITAGVGSSSMLFGVTVKYRKQDKKKIILQEIDLESDKFEVSTHEESLQRSLSVTRLKNNLNDSFADKLAKEAEKLQKEASQPKQQSYLDDIFSV